VKVVRIENVSKGTQIADRAHLARSMWSRTLGLMGKAGLEQGGGLIIEPCSSIHTLFMRFPIDVIYCDSERRVVRTVAALKPWRLNSSGSLLGGARYTIELPAGAIEASHTLTGDQLAFEDAPLSKNGAG
jgi:uncharacterized membrane protein (UPF0127 family)